MKVVAPNTPFEGQYESTEHPAGDSGSGTKTIDWNNGNCQTVNMTGNCTFAFSNLQSGGRYMLRLIEDETGNRIPTWPSEVHWPTAGAPALSGTNKVDLIAFYCAGGTLFGSYSLNYAA